MASPCHEFNLSLSPPLFMASEVAGHRFKLACIETKGDWPFVKKDPWTKGKEVIHTKLTFMQRGF